MYIHSVRLKNIRGFEKVEFDLKRPNAPGKAAGWTVFTGDNGSGKSTVLRAIAMAIVGRETAQVLQPELNGWLRESARPREGSVELQVLATERYDDFSGGGGGRTSYTNSFKAELQLAETQGEKSETVILEPESTRKTLADRGLWKPSLEPSGWFSCGYGPFRRVFGASQEATRLMVGARTAGFATMFEEAASLNEMDKWLRRLSHKTLEKKEFERRQLEYLLALLKDELMPQHVTIDSVDSDGLWLRDSSNQRLSWNEMSDGYRSALALLADIFRHLVRVYTLERVINDTATVDGHTIINCPGVILIDEIDAHLHPEWQMQIGFWLKKRFPNIQFIVTTHSPIICQAADENGLFHLPASGSDEQPRRLTKDEYNEVIRSRPDTILRSAAFGMKNTRSPHAVKARRRYSELKSKQTSAALSAIEATELAQLKLFAETDELPSET